MWVKVDRDATPDIPKRFSVSAYPTLLVVGGKLEKVHRFQGFKKPGDFVDELREAERRWGLYRSGREWDTPDPRPESICDAGTVELRAAPSEEVPSGITFVRGRTWIAQQGTLFALGDDGVVVARHAVPASIRDLCTDGTRIFGMEYGWTAGKPIHVIDPPTGRVVRSIVTRDNAANRSMGAAGIAWRDGRLYVLEGMRGTIREVHPATGGVTRTIRTDQRWLSSLDFDGKNFVAGSRDALYWFDPATGRTVRRVAVHYPLRAVSYHEGSLYLMEQPVFGYDTAHRRVRIWPKRTTIHRLTLRAE